MNPDKNYTFRFCLPQKTFHYQASKTIYQFHQSSALVRGIMGPLGSGKTTACCFELMRRIFEHPINPKTNRRELVVLIVRNTEQELKDTSLRTWLNLFPEEHFGKYYASERVHKIRLPKIHADVLFRALDRPQDEKKILSLEATWIFVNEARELPLSLIQMLPRRLRYPNMKTCGEYKKGMIMDSNPPDTEHWWYQLFEEQKPEGWKLFKQPSGISQEAENIENLPQGYYKSQMAGLPEEWLKVYRDGNYGLVRTNNAVYPEYQDLKHCQEFEVNPNLPLVLGLDFGRTPCAIFTQIDAFGKWWVMDELTTSNTGAVEFAEILKAKITTSYPLFEVEIFGDPAGGQKSQTDSKTVFESLALGGIFAQPVNTNAVFLRREVLKNLLRSFPEGKAKIQIHPRCKMLRKGLNGGFCYQDQKANEKNQQRVLKNEFSHPVEALEYAILGKKEDVAFFNLAQEKRGEFFPSFPTEKPNTSFYWLDSTEI